MVQFNFERDTKFLYDPYPIGVVKQVIDESFYCRLLDEWPPLELFEFKEKLGNKYSLSELNNPQKYADFIRGNPTWRELYEYVKDPRFVEGVITFLKRKNVDLGLRKEMVVNKTLFASPTQALRNHARRVYKRVRGADLLRVRFEFSMLPSNGGCIRPHTDSPDKIITLVVSAVRDGEWNPAHGGGTDVMRPKDVTKSFNHLNEYAQFEDVETLASFPFEPNQCVVFIKTFNSLHAVRPMTGPASNVLRRTLTINIERVR